MEKFQNINSKAVVIETENIDTDQIIPARFLKTTEKTGLGKYLFYSYRYEENGKAKKSVFNEKAYLRQDSGGQAKILVAGKDFGVGSSREHAVWALMDFGFRVIISSEFGDIFYNNSLKNGLLCIKLKEADIKKLMKLINENKNILIAVNLDEQIVEIKEKKVKFGFQIDRFRKTCLLLGVDELGYILSHEDKIKAYEKQL